MELIDIAKSPHDAVRYEDPSMHGGQDCDDCIHFIAPNRCETVKSPINPEGWCMRWEDRG